MQIDLLDLWRGELTWRRMAVLLRGLPPASAYWRARHESGDWTVAEYQRADLIDVLMAGNWQRAGDAKAARPKPYARPGVAEARDNLILNRALAAKAKLRKG